MRPRSFRTARRGCVLLAAGLAVGVATMTLQAGPAHAQHTATFLDGAYTMTDEACAKLKALAAGGPRNAKTVPWHVLRTGIGHWEGSCGYRKITERKKGVEWRIEAMCHEGPKNTREVWTWVKKGDGIFDVKLRGEKTAKRYTRCDLEKGK